MEFEARTGSTWRLNVGQVYTTLARLERDGMVVRRGADEAGRVLYALTEAGHAELHARFARPACCGSRGTNTRSHRPPDLLSHRPPEPPTS
jgi:DNA-binding PadR family transcriptional regulator